MSILLLRHADAASAVAGGGDRGRPLTDRGHAQAIALASQLADRQVSVALSSPARRCQETLTPLVDASHLVVTTDDALAEGAPAAAIDALLTRHAVDEAVLCTHADVLAVVVTLLRERGLPAVTGAIRPAGGIELNGWPAPTQSTMVAPPRIR